MKKLFNFSILCAILTIAMSGCDLIFSDEPSFTSFTFTGQKGKSKINVKNRTVEAVAEVTVDLAAITPNFKLSPTGTEATVIGEQQISGATTQSFWEPVKYILTTADGVATAWTVTITYPDGNNNGGGGKDNPQGRLKAATIKYIDANGQILYFCFDNYGKQTRYYSIDPSYENGRGIIIIDEINGKYHWWNPEVGWMPGEPQWAGIRVFASEEDLSSWDLMVSIGFATKTAATIAGQPCSVYKFQGAEFAVWSKSVFLRIRHDLGENALEAVSARTGCPANAFTQTVDIAW